MVHAQWNLALYPDSSLVVVPGSHKRPRTDMERNADPFEDDMPGQVFVKMEPGDVSGTFLFFFFFSNLLPDCSGSCYAHRMRYFVTYVTSKHTDAHDLHRSYFTTTTSCTAASMIARRNE